MGSFLSTSGDAADPPKIKRPQFSALPVEIALHIASYFVRQDINNLRSVNRFWNKVLLEMFGERNFGLLDLLPDLHLQEGLVQVSEDKRLSRHVQQICINSALSFTQLVQRSESGHFDREAMYAQEAASDHGRVDALLCLIRNFPNLVSLDLHLGIADWDPYTAPMFANQKMQHDLCNMINALIPELEHLLSPS